ncbi:hypothetical protein CHUAL_011793 [Chamberlinius hualienensis]
MTRLLPILCRAGLPAFNLKTFTVGNKVKVSQLRGAENFMPWYVNYSWRGYARHPGTVLRRAQELLTRLTPGERAILLRELQAYEKACTSSTTSSRESSLINDNTDAVSNSSAGESARLTSSQKRSVALASAIPFIGFGFLDNFIMIIAGDYIDITLGATLAISTMAAAALGNLISDVAGVGSAWYVESLSSKVGIVPPILTPTQLAMPSTTWCIYLGKALGVTIGCLLGMFPLLFLPKSNKTGEAAESS